MKWIERYNDTIFMESEFLSYRAPTVFIINELSILFFSQSVLLFRAEKCWASKIHVIIVNGEKDEKSFSIDLH